MDKGAFTSALRAELDAFVAEKRALGYRYTTEHYLLRGLDRHLRSTIPMRTGLTKSVVESWTAKRSHESTKTRSVRATVARQFAAFLQRHGIASHVLPSHSGPIVRSDFAPRIFTRVEVAALLENAVAMRPDSRSPHRHLVLPEIFHLLYGCGLRCGEALRFTVADVDLTNGVLLVREGKFRKDRLVPVSSTVLRRLRVYAARLGQRQADAIFFAAPHGGSYTVQVPYVAFRMLLRASKIPHGGRGNGPRMHDLRHTFAVHRLEAWYREGADLGAKMPILATYMGHQTYRGTQRYLHLTAELFPDIANRMEALVGALVPRLGQT